MKTIILTSLVLISLGLSAASYSLQDQLIDSQSRSGRCLECKTEQELPLKSLSLAQKKRMRSMAYQLATQLWPDTILEGPYQTDYKIQILSVELVSFARQSSLYRITYAANAWDMDSCSIEDDSEDYSECEQGRIVESAYLPLDLSWIERDEERFANFEH